jgi:beta-lactamase class A
MSGQQAWGNTFFLRCLQIGTLLMVAGGAMLVMSQSSAKTGRYGSEYWPGVPSDMMAALQAMPFGLGASSSPLVAMPSDTIMDEPLQQALDRLAATYPSTIVPYVFTLNTATGKAAGIRGNKPVSAASVIKLPILVSLMHYASQQALPIDETTWRYDDIHRASGSGDLQYQQSGQKLTLQRLAEKMIQISDNTATNIIVDNLGGMDTLNQQWQQWGMTGIRLNNWLPDLRGTNTVTCEELARLLYTISLPNSPLPYASQMRQIMLGTVNRRLLVAGVPSGTPVAHKTGDIGTVIGDVGLVRIKDQDVIVCILVKRPRNAEAGRAFIRQAMATIYQHTLATLKGTPPEEGVLRNQVSSRYSHAHN